MRYPDLKSAQAAFLEAFPEYQTTQEFDDLRARDYGRLDAADHVYLDYTGGGLYARSQIEAHQSILLGQVFGNPHSHNPTSEAATQMVESARRYVLEFFNADPEEYAVVFTANASAALKLVGEAYPFSPNDRYLLAFDNHNSVNGIREFARKRGASIDYVPLIVPDMAIQQEVLEDFLDRTDSGRNHLFAYPAQSNFSGVQHPLEWVDLAQARGWDVLLDAAAFVPTNVLDLRVVRPDFVTLSFYKMFGYPTGVGALIARRRALAKLHRPWFSGGTITVASVQGDRYFMAEGSSAFEDGTVDYLNIPGVEIGLRHLRSVGVAAIHERCRILTSWLLGRLLDLEYDNGHPLVRLYGPRSMDRRGGTVTFNFYTRAGTVIDHQVVEAEASRDNISLRTGCFCNPGGGEVALDLSKTELIGCFEKPEVQARQSFTPDDFRLCVDGKSTGAVRVSVGLASNFRDVHRFLRFAERFVATPVGATS